MNQLFSIIITAVVGLQSGQILAQKKIVVKPKPSIVVAKKIANVQYDLGKDYFPLTLGSSWKYQLSSKVNGARNERLPDDVVSRQVLRVNVLPDGAKEIVVDCKSSATTPEASTSYKVFNKAVYITNYLEVFVNTYPDGLSPIEPILNSNIDAGAKWDWVEKAKPGETLQVARKHSYHVVGKATILSPSGTFECIHVQRIEGYFNPKAISGTNEPTGNSIDYWYAPGVGLIQEVVKTDYLVKTYLLQSFEVKSVDDKARLATSKEEVSSLTKLAPTEYFPITVGSRWKYQDVLQTNDKYEIIAKSIYPSTDGKSADILFDKLSNGVLLKCIPFQITNYAVEKLPTTLDHHPDFKEMRLTKTMLKFPIIVGDSWEEKGEYFADRDTKVQTQSKATVAPVEAIKTPAGIFQAFKVHETINASVTSTVYSGKHQSLTIEVDTWFAPKVGMVRRLIHDGTVAGNSNSDQVLQCYTIK